jgi:hypothetical protein
LPSNPFERLRLRFFSSTTRSQTYYQPAFAKHFPALQNHTFSLPPQLLPKQLLPKQLLPKQLLPKQLLSIQLLSIQLLPKQLLSIEQPHSIVTLCQTTFTTLLTASLINTSR